MIEQIPLVMLTFTGVRQRAQETLSGLMTLFPSERYQVTWWWERETFSSRVVNRATRHAHLAVWHQRVSPESVIAAAAEWQRRGEPDTAPAREE